MANNLARPYVVSITTTHPVNGEQQTHDVQVDAYEVTEAGYTALVELDAKFALAEQGYKIKLLSVRPDTKRAGELFSRALEEIGLISAATTGRKS